MRIEILTSEKRLINIPLPMGLLKFFSSDKVMSFILKNMTEQERKNLQLVDFSIFRYNLDELQKYEGLVVVDIESSDGTFVKVIV